MGIIVSGFIFSGVLAHGSFSSSCHLLVPLRSEFTIFLPGIQTLIQSLKDDPNGTFKLFPVQPRKFNNTLALIFR